MSSVDNTAKLISVKNRTLEVEGELEKLLRNIGMKRRIDFERPNDYGERMFNLVIVFDEINVESFSDENVKKMKELFREYIELRKKQRPLEREYDSNAAIKSQIKNGIRAI